jgi:hypothetical protein
MKNWRTQIKQNVRKMFVFAVIATAATMQAKARVSSKAIVVDSPSDLPEVAQRPTEAMYLYDTGHSEVVLYLEQDQGRTLSILDVTDPAKIRAIGQVSIAASAPFDFVQSLHDDSEVLIHYRNDSGFGVISLGKYRHPKLTPEPNFLHPAKVQIDGPNTLLLVSTNAPGAQDPAVQYCKSVQSYTAHNDRGSIPTP